MLRKRDQHPVALGMAQLVVHLLEVVQVNEHQRRRMFWRVHN